MKTASFNYVQRVIGTDVQSFRNMRLQTSVREKLAIIINNLAMQ